MDIYSTLAMLGVLQSLRAKAPRFLLNMFFPLASFSDDEKIIFDVEVDDIEIAPFVSPLAAGRVGADTGYETRMFAPAYVKPLHDIKPGEPLRRLAGEPLTGTLSAGAREQAILGAKLQRQLNQILRRKEVMAAEVLRTGKCVVKGDDYPEVLVDFQRDGDLSLVLSAGARWGEAGVSPYADVSEWTDLVGRKSGAAVNVVVMDAKAWALFESDPKLEKVLDRTLGQAAIVQMGFQPGVPGTPVFKGRIGMVEFYTYNDTYKDAGATKELLPDYTVLLGATGAMEGIQAHGAILDPRAGYQALEVFPKSWIEENPGRRMLLSQSAPLVYPRRPNACMCATVR